MGLDHAFPSCLSVCACTRLGNKMPHCGEYRDPVIGSSLSGREGEMNGETDELNSNC